MWRRTPPDVYREVFEAAPDAILLVADDGTIADANRRAGELFGWALEDLIGQPVEVLVPAEDRDRHRRHREHYADAPRPRPMGRNLQLWGVRRDGSSFPIDVSLSPVSSAARGLVAAAV
ncbi:MAG TPA: PAS domain S-box protein, partial [Acidimicrobiales bacterium]|nr:PAS domain S-box protein [Acidimicrobiales bacterium]